MEFQAVLVGILIGAAIFGAVLLVMEARHSHYVARIDAMLKTYDAKVHQDIDSFKSAATTAISKNLNAITRPMVEIKADVENLKNKVGGVFRGVERKPVVEAAPEPEPVADPAAESAAVDASANATGVNQTPGA